MADDEQGIGIGTVVGALFIMILILVLAFTNKELLGESKKTFDDTFDTQEAIDVFKDALRDEQDRVLIELETVANAFDEAFDYASDYEGSDCVVRIDTSSFDDDIVVEFREGGAMRVMKEKFVEKIVRRNLDEKIYFNFDGVSNFRIEINDKEFGFTKELFVYKSSEGDIHFLDFSKSSILTGSFSDVLKKRNCGDTMEPKDLEVTNFNIDVVPGTTEEEARDIVNYLNSDFNYLNSNYKLFEILLFLNDIPDDLDFLDTHGREIDFLLERLQEHFGNYFKNHEGDLSIISKKPCWRVWITSGNIDPLVIVYGRDVGVSARYRSISLELSDGRKINLDLDIFLDPLSDNECLSDSKTNNLERNPLAKGTFKGSNYSIYSKDGYIG